MEKETIKFNLPDFLVNIVTTKMSKTDTYRDLHSHAAVEIVKVEEGRCDVAVKDEIISLKKGDILLINHNTVHKIIPNDVTVSYMQIDISAFISRFSKIHTPYIMDFILEDTLKSHILAETGSDIDILYRKIKEECEGRRDFYELYVHSYLLQLTAFILRNGFIVGADGHIGSMVQKILPVARYINDNYNTPLTLDRICEDVFWDRFHLCRIFKKVSGGTVFEYVNFVRIKKAREMLEGGDKTAAQIANECGFSSVHYFNRIFKKETGTTPLGYRKIINKL